MHMWNNPVTRRYARALRTVKRWLGYAWFRSYGVPIGSGLVIEGTFPRLENYGKMAIGRRFSTRTARPLYVLLQCRQGAELTIGNEVFLNEGVSVAASSRIVIGDNCLIGDNVQIHDSDYHQVDVDRPMRVLPIEIGRNVWIGRNAIISPGVTIGDHAIIGAGSVVTQSVPARMIYAGIPAREIGEIRAEDGFIRR